MAVDLQTGAVEWEITPDGSGQCCSVAPAVGPNRTYIANTADAEVVGVDATGDVRWRYEGSAVPAAKPAVTDESCMSRPKTVDSITCGSDLCRRSRVFCARMETFTVSWPISWRVPS